MFQAEVIGSLGRDAEIKEIKGQRYIKFSVAHRDRKDDPIVWVSVLQKAYGDNIQAFVDMLRKGAVVFARGRVFGNVYEAKVQYTLWADEVKVCKYADRGQQDEVGDMPDDDEAF